MGVGVQGKPGAVVPQHPGHCFYVPPFWRARVAKVCLKSWNLTRGSPARFSTRWSMWSTLFRDMRPPVGLGNTQGQLPIFFSADSKRLLYPLPEAGCDRAFFVSRGISTISPLILTTCRLIRRLFCSKSRSTYCRPRSSPAQAGDQLHIVEHEYSTFLSPRRKDANCSTGRVFYLFVLDREQYAAFSRVGEDRFCSLANSIAEAMI